MEFHESRGHLIGTSGCSTSRIALKSCMKKTPNEVKQDVVGCCKLLLIYSPIDFWIVPSSQ